MSLCRRYSINCRTCQKPFLISMINDGARDDLVLFSIRRQYSTFHKTISTEEYHNQYNDSIIEELNKRNVVSREVSNDYYAKTQNQIDMPVEANDRSTIIITGNKTYSSVDDHQDTSTENQHDIPMETRSRKNLFADFYSSNPTTAFVESLLFKLSRNVTRNDLY